ncbi:D-alanyl-D-alanine carboxypeptidase [Acidiferrimicrobium sp. IK]|uniref:D-alanyl-D-alanine carboxypeptidase/D-alanyl-D-alanine-endopeptidase n=1 Tax=Acidiferrimicrobium sp. IK TaxID=2871700 RepID=UPI0021CB6BB9|nr:D-alanyl-D-alanine carboxypeptidase [Acidiferrimicrobium sp. IK]MCU4184648.1 D-alanyl-D-alanine carboxypeptidase [Acidiferrimicrobium sp. IK]
MSRRGRLLQVAAGLAVMAGAAAVPGATAAAPTTPAAGASMPTPLLSVRRVPGWIESTLAGQRVAATLAGIVTPAALGPATACLLVEQGGRVLTARNATTPVIPASNMKILTATAALDKLGPGYRYTTAVKADRAPAGGVVTGNLYLIGSGDPVLRTPQYEATLRDTVPPYTSLAALAAQVRAAGVTEVTGAVIGDESRYDTQRRIPTWKPVYTEEGDAGPLSALNVDDGFASTPTGFVGATQPAQAAAQTFTALLAAAGVKVDGPAAGQGSAPAAAVPVTSIQSAPLSQILDAILTPSDDTAAELVTKELGKVAGGGGTTAAGTAVIKADLTADGLPVAGLVAVDGSGLDRGDRATCALVVAALDRAGTGSALISELPVAGKTGTLSYRMRGTPAVGRVLAKTGTLDDVSALSGFVLASTTAPAPTLQLRAPVVFSLIMNGVPVSTGIDLGNRVGVALAGYPVVPAVSTLDPQT